MVHVNDTCIGCGACVSVCPKGFKFNEEGKSIAISEEVLDCTQEAVDSCPVAAIEI